MTVIILMGGIWKKREREASFAYRINTSRKIINKMKWE